MCAHFMYIRVGRQGPGVQSAGCRLGRASGCGSSAMAGGLEAQEGLVLLVGSAGRKTVQPQLQGHIYVCVYIHTYIEERKTRKKDPWVSAHVIVRLAVGNVQSGLAG